MNKKNLYICVSEHFMLIGHVGQIFEISYFHVGKKKIKEGKSTETTRSLDLCFLMHLDIAICISDVSC